MRRPGRVRELEEERGRVGERSKLENIVFVAPDCSLGQNLPHDSTTQTRRQQHTIPGKQILSKHALKRIVDAINESPERVLNVKQRDRLLRLAEHQALLRGLGFRALTLNPKPFRF